MLILYIYIYIYIYISIRFFYIKNSTFFFFTSVPFWNTTLVIFFGFNSSFGIQNCCTGIVLEYRIVALDLSALDLINLF